MKWLFALFLAIICVPVHADELRPAYIEFTQTAPNHWQMFWKVPIRGGITPQSKPILPASCQIIGEPTREIINMALITKSEVNCAETVLGKTIGLDNFDAAQTDVFVRIAPQAGNVQSLRLSAEKPIAQIKANPSTWQVAQSYFVTGIEHILTGYDHLLFVVSLVFLLLNPWTIAKAATSFTIAHSITLVGTTMGLIGLPQRPVEALIALSIIFMAVEIIKKEPEKPRLSERIPWVIAFLFGLIHGFGFAGALREIGMPEGEVPIALLTFNIGVEIGQLIIVASVLGLFYLLNKYAKSTIKPAMKTATYMIGIIASFWFIERLLT